MEVSDKNNCNANYQIHNTHIDRFYSEFFKFVHNSVRYRHIFEHTFQFRSELTATLSLYNYYYTKL